MTEPMAFVNGDVVPVRRLAAPIDDAGFMLGTTVAEQLRTFRGELFRLEAHLDRLATSLKIIGVVPQPSLPELATVARDLAARNHALLAAGDDLRLTLLVTPGPLGLLEAGRPRPFVAIYTTPLAFGQWADKYASGESLVTTDVEQVPARCWPPELKCRSRMHYFLADRKAQAIEPGARALMLDEHGFVLEATTANILSYRRPAGLITPPRAKLLPGISLAFVGELASQLGVPLAERDLRPADLAAGDELLLMSTSPCLLPVVRLNGQPIGTGRPGPMFEKLLAAWSAQVGLEIAAQAQQFAQR